MFHNDTNDIITIDELCEALNIGKNSAYRLLNAHEIKAFRIGRIWKIPKQSVQDYILKQSGILTS